MAPIILGEAGKESEYIGELTCHRPIVAKCDNRFGGEVQKSNRIVISTKHDVVVLVEGYGASEQHAIDISFVVSETYASVLDKFKRTDPQPIAMPVIIAATKELHSLAQAVLGDFGAYVTAIEINGRGNKVGIVKAGNIHAIILEVQQGVLRSVQPTLDHTAYGNPWNKSSGNGIGSTRFAPDTITQQFSPLHQIVAHNTGIKTFADSTTIGRNIANFTDGFARIWKFTGNQIQDSKNKIWDTRSLVHIGPLPRPT